MVIISERLKAKARAKVEELYTGSCDIYEYRQTRDPDTKITAKDWQLVYEKQPCRLSFETLRANAESETAAALAQGVKLFLAPEISVKAGSKIVVSQDGKTAVYRASGEPAVHPYHQEIVLELFERWA